MLHRVLAILVSIAVSTASYAATKPNIVLITLESARSDRMGFLGSKQKITTNLDMLARQSIVFEQAYAQAPTTVASQATVLTGTYPQSHQVTEFATAPLSTSLPCLPGLLQAAGYRTAAFVGTRELDPKNGFAPGFDRGFSVYDAGFRPPAPGQSRYATVMRRGAEVIARATAWLDRSAQGPFFLWIQISDPDAAPRASYNSAISASDAAVGKLLSTLRARRVLDDSLIVVTSDHGSSLGAHGEDNSRLFLHDETIHVPLLLKLPQNQDAAKRVHAKVALVSVAPTILEVAGVAIPSQMQGQSLIRIARGNAPEQPVYSRNDYTAQAYGLSPIESWRAGKFLYIRAPKPELYDLSSDPSATRNLAQSSRATFDTMASQLASFDQHFSSTGSQTSQLTSTQMQKLASLGYVGLQKTATAANQNMTGTDPKDATTVANRIATAKTLLDEGKPEPVQTLLASSMASAAGMFEAQYLMGSALVEQGKYAQAIPFLHRAIELQPDSPWAHYRMGKGLLRTNDYKTAAIHLEIATDRLPNCASAHALLAQAYAHTGKPEDAKRETTKSMQK
jgi:arylsulfatase A-like enzyme/Flp pilus assembly protein TadD